MLWLQRKGVRSSRRDQVGGLDQQERQLEIGAYHVLRRVLQHASITAIKDKVVESMPSRDGMVTTEPLAGLTVLEAA